LEINPSNCFEPYNLFFTPHLSKPMVIPDLPEEVTQMELKDEKRAMGMERDKNVPDWVRNNAGWWADGLISDDDFISGIKYLVEQGIIKV